MLTTKACVHRRKENWWIRVPVTAESMVHWRLGHPVAIAKYQPLQACKSRVMRGERMAMCSTIDVSSK